MLTGEWVRNKGEWEGVVNVDRGGVRNKGE